VTDAVGGTDALERLGHEVSRVIDGPIDVDGIPLASAGSIGIAWSPDHGTTPSELLRRADLAMYAAKRTGTNVRFFDYANDEANVARLQLSAQLGSAIDQGELQLWFQPIVELSTRRVCGFEGLVRWHHPELGILQPGAFLELIEISRHFGRLSRTAVAQGIDLLSALPDQVESVSVNVSVRDVLDPTFVSHLGELLERRAIDPRRLVLEIVEREVADDSSDITDACRRIAQLGPRLAIDDFGIGQSSLLRLHKLPVDHLKIDQSFVRGLGTGDADAALIVSSIINLAHSMGLRTVGEGVETDAVARALARLGCDYAQGYLFSEARMATDLGHLLDPAPIEHPQR
jgi:EAL domain-containing protein (putative c-di-GMP-specific phosphodiesterase class I)